MQSWLKVVLNAIFAIAFVVTCSWTARNKYLTGCNDFLQFHAGARLAYGEGLYDPEVVAAEQYSNSGMVAGPALARFVRLPHYAVLLSPLGLLPYLPAYIVWQLLNLVAVIGAIRVWPYSRLVFAHTLAVWIPLYWAFANGQDLGLMLLGLSAAIRYLSRQEDRETAWALAACLIKYHFLWLVPIALARRRRVMLMLAALGTALLLLPCLINPGWMREYYETVVLSRPVISKVPFTLYPILGWYGLVAGAAVIAIIATRIRRPEVALASAVAVSVIVSPHAFFQDYTLCAPLVALIIRSRQIKPSVESKTDAGSYANRASICDSLPATQESAVVADLGVKSKALSF